MDLQKKGLISNPHQSAAHLLDLHLLFLGNVRGSVYGKLKEAFSTLWRTNQGKFLVPALLKYFQFNWLFNSNPQSPNAWSSAFLSY